MRNYWQNGGRLPMPTYHKKNYDLVSQGVFLTKKLSLKNNRIVRFEHVFMRTRLS